MYTYIICHITDKGKAEHDITPLNKCHYCTNSDVCGWPGEGALTCVSETAAVLGVRGLLRDTLYVSSLVWSASSSVVQGRFTTSGGQDTSVKHTATAVTCWADTAGVTAISIRIDTFWNYRLMEGFFMEGKCFIQCHTEPRKLLRTNLR